MYKLCICWLIVVEQRELIGLTKIAAEGECNYIISSILGIWSLQRVGARFRERERERERGRERRDGPPPPQLRGVLGPRGTTGEKGFAPSLSLLLPPFSTYFQPVPPFPSSPPPPPSQLSLRKMHFSFKCMLAYVLTWKPKLDSAIRLILSCARSLKRHLACWVAVPYTYLLAGQKSITKTFTWITEFNYNLQSADL